MKTKSVIKIHLMKMKIKTHTHRSSFVSNDKYLIVKRKKN